jgi:hypothetical protein
MDIATIAAFHGSTDVRLSALERDLSSVKDDIKGAIPDIATLKERSQHTPTMKDTVGLLVILLSLIAALTLFQGQIRSFLRIADTAPATNVK